MVRLRHVGWLVLLVASVSFADPDTSFEPMIDDPDHPRYREPWHGKGHKKPPPVPTLPPIPPLEPDECPTCSLEPEVLELGSRRELFVDKRRIESMVNASHVLHSPAYQGKVLDLDKPWEGPNLVPRVFFGDEVDGTYSWGTGSDISWLAGRVIRLRFILIDADVFSYRFSD